MKGIIEAYIRDVLITHSPISVIYRQVLNTIASKKELQSWNFMVLRSLYL